MQSLIPAAKVGHIGLYRDPKTLEPVEYYCKLPPDIEKRDVFVVDPMLATGGSSSAAITKLKEHGCSNIRFLCIIAAPAGLKRLQADHPDIDIYIGAMGTKPMPSAAVYAILFWPRNRRTGISRLPRRRKR